MKKIKPENIKLDKYEQYLEDHFEEAKELPPEELKREKEMLIQAAKEHNKAKKDKRITIRIPKKDLEKIKEFAYEEGLPYQTFITSILHKISTGRLKIA